MGLNKFGDAVADVAAVYVYDNEQDAAYVALVHLDAARPARRRRDDAAGH
ncbi:hypothetical protein GTY54_29290 [Streptomyces sp. SID625]|nr:hypothetical protein [Streptomyces sp. SID625]